MPKGLRYPENCVYAVDTPNGVKIGFTSRLGDRLSAMQKKHECPCYPIALIRGLTRKDAMRIEIEMHEKFSESGVGGEYFDAILSDIVNEFARAGGDALI